ncbi:Diphthamide biosynthesis protein 2 [Coemansia sp. RSA 1813]|nr:Diphthamide biosynthesis protein 2 [Coemansia sp. RSA 1646]KAJ1772758.1 Diphthamide biosynthesis protein 2 [Coemansia sp. RSA 1843]KAJ2090709.1 Diphthamide biosynthesis protein 2 [Coemansia sp. RSA 986]KAJ2216085.1 Diphthamide biosynthesis protein 2 [Coemansia sp. RSA 487]KAJ2570074.1 Diphthamide biosynthesis protein 2 [Coemansia sp. RSA 1813]
MNAPAPVDNDGRDVIERTGIKSSKRAYTAAEANLVYEISQTAKVINDNGFKRIALQFPDELLADSSLVSAELQRQSPDTRIFTLADTSYGSCCVDEVAAEHYSADLVVHYGRTCLSLTTRIPVFYVFGREQIDIDDCVGKLSVVVEQGTNILLLSDVGYMYKIEDIAVALRDRVDSPFGSVVTSKITAADRVYMPSSETNDIQPGRSWKLPNEHAIGDYTILYIGQESLTLTNVLLTQRSKAIYSYDPRTQLLREEGAKANRHLGRRYYMVQQAQDADVVGIVVGTLAASRYLRVVETLKTLLRQAQRKFYIFVVGKLNVAKLANFPEIDAFVLVACPENTLVDSREYFKPIVTPYELHLAVTRSKEWTGDYITDFRGLLDEIEDSSQLENDEDDTPHYSLITGKLKQRRRYVDPRQNAESGSSDLVLANKNTEIAQYLGSAGAEYLLNRSFRGLGHDDEGNNTGENELPPALAAEGRNGIARGYNNEPHTFQ